MEFNLTIDFYLECEEVEAMNAIYMLLRSVVQ